MEMNQSDNTASSDWTLNLRFDFIDQNRKKNRKPSEGGRSRGAIYRRIRAKGVLRDNCLMYLLIYQTNRLV